jgi:hypothetical protein
MIEFDDVINDPSDIATQQLSIAGELNTGALL